MTTETVYTDRSNAIRAARKALKAEGVEAPLSMVHFKVNDVEGGFTWTPIQVGPEKSAAEAFEEAATPPAEPAKAKGKAKEDDPRLWINGERFPNLARANEARRLAAAAEKAKAPKAEKPAPTPRSESKHAKVMAMLSRPEGTSLAEIMAETGWQKHTSSAFISHAKRKGLKFETLGERGGLRYRLIEEVSAAA